MFTELQRVKKSANTFHQYRFSASVIANDSVDFSWFKFPGDSVKHFFSPERLFYVHDLYHVFPSVPVKMKL